MGEKNLWSKIGLIVLLAGMCIWQLYPPREKLKPGIDLGGGHSLLFEIDDTGLEHRRDLAVSVMNVLKKRVDPQGNRNLIWRPIGRNRLEIQMPRPQSGQKERLEAYEKTTVALNATNITTEQIRNALGLPAEEQQAEFAKLTGVVKSREDLFNKLAEVDKKYRELNEKYSQLQAASTQPVGGELANQIDQAFNDRNQLMEKLLETNLETRMLSDLLELGPQSKARIEGLRKVKEAHPDLVSLIDEMASAYDEYAKYKGALDDPSDLMRLLRGAGVLEFRILATTDVDSKMLDSSNPSYNEPLSKYEEQLTKFGPRPRPGDNYQWFKLAKQEEERFGQNTVIREYAGARYVLSHSRPDMGLLNDGTWNLEGARYDQDTMGRPAVGFVLDRSGGNQFWIMTGNNVNRPLCIFLDNEAVSAANIAEQIPADGQISGDFSDEYVWYLISTLEAGALPARLKEVPLQQKSIGPSLGETNRAKGEQAIKIAFLVTILFMLGYYMYNGAIADIALLLNLIITLGIMSFLQATFTLPGIAGLILTLGMAVDANVLIYERIREELHLGASTKKAVKLGYEKAFSAILDSNITTIITALILGSLGSEEIKGFGLTLGIGLCTSMFTALFVTRQFFHVMVPEKLNLTETRRAWMGTGILALAGGGVFGLGWLFNATPELREESTLIGFSEFLGVMFATAAVLMVALWFFRIMYKATGYQKANRLPMMRLFGAPNINWIGKHKIFWTISALVIIGGFIFEAGVKKEDYLDIEFIGGTSVQVEVKDEYKDMTDEELFKRIASEDEADGPTVVTWLEHAAQQIENLSMTDAGNFAFVM
ncbi:MAG: protein translocase subunit SecD, partial [Planctomycetota bacterium]